MPTTSHDNPTRRAPRIPAWRPHRLGRALARLDQGLLVLCRRQARSAPVRSGAGALGDFGEWGLGWSAIGLLGAAIDPGRRAAWVAAAAAGPAAVGINYVIKLRVGRQRPLLDDHPRLARTPSKLSFPSAHATSSFAAATAMGRIAPAATPALTALALAICAGRPVLGVHYPSDVIAGILLGRELGRRWPLLGGARAEEREVWAR